MSKIAKDIVFVLVLIKMMLKTVNLFRYNLQYCAKCRTVLNRVCTSAVLYKLDFISSKGRLRLSRDDIKKYENTFGDLDSFEMKFERIQDDPEDIAEYERERKAMGKSLFQYKNEISALLSRHEYKEAKRVLEEDMVNDKIKSDIGIYRMFFNYTAQIGDLEEAYKLYIRYRKRQGRMTGPMYTSLFNACANCKNSLSALTKAEIIKKNLAEDKFHKVNICNYNAMLKAFGRHGDIPTCLNIFDEVLEKNLKAFTYTYNFLLQSCISDKNSGLRHALLVWRKMLQNRRKPDIWFFNLFLRCVRDCSLGDIELIPDLIKQINKESGKFFKKKEIIKEIDGKKIRKVITVRARGTKFLNFLEENASKVAEKKDKSDVSELKSIEIDGTSQSDVREDLQAPEMIAETISQSEPGTDEEKSECNELKPCQDQEDRLRSSEESIPVLESNLTKLETVEKSVDELPDLLAFEPSIGSVVSFGAMSEPHHRIMLFGGVEGFLKTMMKFNVRPNVITITLLLNVSPPTTEAEQKILELAKAMKIQLDAGFFAQFIQKRIYSGRGDLIKDCLREMQKANVQPDIMCFGVLAFGCHTLEMGMELLETLKVYGYRPNTEILYGLLYRAGGAMDFAYVKAILDRAKADDVELSPKFIAKLGKIVKFEKRKRRRTKSSGEQAGLTDQLAE